MPARVGIDCDLHIVLEPDLAQLGLLQVGRHPDPPEIVDGQDRLAGLHHIALEHPAFGHGAGKRRHHDRILQLGLGHTQLRPGYGDLGEGDGGFGAGRLQRLLGVAELLLRDDGLLELHLGALKILLRPFQVDPGKRQALFGQSQAGPGLFGLRTPIRVIQLHQKLSLFHRIAFIGCQTRHAPENFGADGDAVGIDISVVGGNEVPQLGIPVPDPNDDGKDEQQKRDEHALLAVERHLGDILVQRFLTLWFFHFLPFRVNLRMTSQRNPRRLRFHSDPDALY